jgi:transposase-like protein
MYPLAKHQEYACAYEREDRVREVITSVQRRRRWSAEEKAATVQETYASGMSVSLVARRHAWALA